MVEQNKNLTEWREQLIEKNSNLTEENAKLRKKVQLRKFRVFNFRSTEYNLIESISKVYFLIISALV